MSPCCPRCGGDVREPDLAVSAWRCTRCGPISPLHIAEHMGADALRAISGRISADQYGIPLWCPWPLPRGFMVTGAGWAGDEQGGVQATAVACSGPAPLRGGPADLVLVAEEPGVGLGNRLAGLGGIDPAIPSMTPTAGAKISVAGRDTPVWNVGNADDRIAYVGEARGRWLYVIAWPPDTGYVLDEHIALQDLSEWLPAELVFGAPSPRLHARG